jgi:hypothetical protein
MGPNSSKSSVESLFGSSVFRRIRISTLCVGALSGGLATTAAAAQEIKLNVTYVCNGEHIYVDSCNIRDLSDTATCIYSAGPAGERGVVDCFGDSCAGGCFECACRASLCSSARQLCQCAGEGRGNGARGHVAVQVCGVGVCEQDAGVPEDYERDQCRRGFSGSCGCEWRWDVSGCAAGDLLPDDLGEVQQPGAGMGSGGAA